MTTLTGVLPETANAWNRLSTYANAHGITIAVADFGGIRTQADTTRILQYRDADYKAAVDSGAIASSMSLQRFRPIAAFGSSYHNYGAAFDVRVVSRPAGMTEQAALKQLGSFAPTLGMRWGGTFTNPDTPHFELAISLDEAKRRYGVMTGTTLPGIAGGFSNAFDGFGFGDDSPEETAPDDGGEWLNLDTSGMLFPDAPTDGLLILGLIVVGAMAFVLRSHYR